MRAPWVLLAACGGGAATPDAAPVDAACNPSVLPLVVSRQDGVVDRVHGSARYLGAPAWLLVDTGSATTFVQEPLGSPDPVPNAGTFDIGCSAVMVDGRPEVPDPPIDGVPVVGTLGTDRLLPGPTAIDFTTAQLVFGTPGDPSWPSAPYDVVDGSALAHVTLDGQPIRLLVDTGDDDTLWLGQQPQPGDTEIDTVDAEGHPLVLYLGSATLAIGAWQATVRVLRVPSWPYLEQTIAQLGGDVGGLLGLSSMGQRVVFDHGTLEVSP